MLGKINWHPDHKQVKVFAVTLAIAVIMFAAVIYLLGKQQSAIWIALIGLALAAISFLFHPIGRIVYTLWMGFGFILGKITTPIIAAIIYYLVLMPVGLFFRLTGKDTLKLRKPSDCTSYFTNHDPPMDKERFFRQF